MLAVKTAPTRDVEGHRAQVTLLDELDSWTRLDHLAGDLVTEDQTLRRACASPDHVLIGAADVRGDDLQDRPVRGLATHVVRMHARAVLELKRRKVDVLHFDLARPHVGHPTVVSHLDLPLFV